jgi:protein involved in polysaccharide export with SLBB domain
MKIRGKEFHAITAAFFFVIIFCSCASQQLAATPPQIAPGDSPESAPAPYIIQPEDKLDIKFFFNSELNETVTVRPDGKISLQFVDEVQAAGLKPSELDDILTKKYASQFAKPDLTVIVRTFAGQRIYVGGEVNREGLQIFSGRLTPLQAVFNAGGFKETANAKNTLVIRKGPGNAPIPIRLNLAELMKGKISQESFLLQPDDIVYVPKTGIAKANQFVSQYIADLFMIRGVSLGFNYELNSDYR